MTRFLLAGAAALAVMTGTAMAQTWQRSATTEETTTYNPTVPAPYVVRNSATTGHAVLSDGDRTASNGSSWTSSNGNKTETSITNQTYPLTGMITTTKKTTSFANGVATETKTVTNTYPPQAMRPPEVTTTTRTYAVGSN